MPMQVNPVSTIYNLYNLYRAVIEFHYVMAAKNKLNVPDK